MAGKGGSGKTSLVALMAKLAREKGFKVLVIDADESNPGIERMLGIAALGSSVIERVGGRKLVFGEEKDAASNFVQATVSSILKEVENREFSLVQVGKIREAGSGCACPHGAISRELLARPLPQDILVLVDVEAGVEHFGRAIDMRADMVLFVVDPSYAGVELCEEAKKLSKDSSVRFLAVVNKVQDDETLAFLKDELKKRAIDVNHVIPYDEEVVRSALLGKPIKADKALSSIEKLLKDVLKDEIGHKVGKDIK